MTIQYKLILADLDGTLLTDEQRLLPSTETTIRELVKSGILFATVSARNKSYTKEAICSLSDICCANAYINGGLIETADGRIILDSPINKEELVRLIEKCDEEKASFCFVTKDQSFARNRHTKNLERIQRTFCSFNGAFSEDFTIHDSNGNVYLMMVIGDNLEPIKELAEGTNSIKYESIISPISGIKAILITSRTADKGAALRAIAEYYEVELESTIAFGDSPINDKPMMKAAGCGVAMKNAHPLILDKADKTTEKNNNEDGVGDYLRLLYGL
ncbi:Cof-type HAD-IIB family hydrolase [Thermodesulfobacteriota bacterium]